MGQILGAGGRGQEGKEDAGDEGQQRGSKSSAMRLIFQDRWNCKRRRDAWNYLVYP